MTEQERADALKLVTSVIARCERALPKFVLGTSQHTLLKNRIQALKIGSALLGGGNVAKDCDQTLTAALEPLDSIIRKCKKHGQSTSRAAGNITAMAARFEQWSYHESLLKMSCTGGRYDSGNHAGYLFSLSKGGIRHFG